MMGFRRSWLRTNLVVPTITQIAVISLWKGVYNREASVDDGITKSIIEYYNNQKKMEIGFLFKYDSEYGISVWCLLVRIILNCYIVRLIHKKSEYSITRYQCWINSIQRIRIGHNAQQMRSSHDDA